MASSAAPLRTSWPRPQTDRASDGGLLDQLATRYATGLASVVSVLDPPLVVLAGSVLRAGGEPLRTRVARELSELAMVSPALVVSTMDGSPVLAGAQYAALDLVRDDVFSSG